VTVIDCIVSESFPYAMLIWGGTKVSIIRTLIAHNMDRNPEVASNTQVTLINNLIYNPSQPSSGAFSVWRGQPVGEPPDGPAFGTLIGNVAKAGPTSGTLAVIFKASAVAGSRAYYADNAFPDSFINEGTYVMAGSPPRPLPSPLTILPSSQVQAYVVANAGARPLDRDPVDTRIINDVINATGSSLHNDESEVGGFPTLAENTRVLSIPANQATIRPSGYSVLEEDVLFPLAAQMANVH
jgi:hypothetical protein